MLSEEDEDCWNNARQRLEAVDVKITCVVFMAESLEKHFPVGLRNKKEIEFLELKQGNMTVFEYVAMFEELVKFCPHYNGATAEGSKCIKFESRLRLEIKQGIWYQEIL